MKDFKEFLNEKYDSFLKRKDVSRRGLHYFISVASRQRFNYYKEMKESELPEGVTVYDYARGECQDYLKFMGNILQKNSSLAEYAHRLKLVEYAYLPAGEVLTKNQLCDVLEDEKETLNSVKDNIRNSGKVFAGKKCILINEIIDRIDETKDKFEQDIENDMTEENETIIEDDVMEE